MNAVNKTSALGEILFLAGPQKGSVFQITQLRMSIGRQKDNDLITSDRSTSRFHAEIRWRNGAWSINKLASHNTLTVNQHEVQQGVLHDHDVIDLGPNTQILFLTSLRMDSDHTPLLQMKNRTEVVAHAQKRHNHPRLDRHCGWWLQALTRAFQWWTWKRVLMVTVVILVVLEGGTYALNWTWTGFGDNGTVWDWLKLLAIPVALAVLPIWFSMEGEKRRAWAGQLKWVLVVTVLPLVLLFIGTIALNWTWTGFKGKALWDWVDVLLVPVLVAILPIWFSLRQSHGGNESSKLQHQQNVQGTEAQQQKAS